MPHFRICLVTAMLVSGTLTQHAMAQEGRAVLYRDTWGVPHVYADDFSQAAYALGYAQAEDRLEDIFINIRTATGTLAEVLGPDHAQQDYIMKLLKNAERCAQYWETAPAHIRQLGDRFMQGVARYLEEHPERRSPFAVELEGWHPLAIGRAMNLVFPLGDVMNELQRKERAPGIGSNAFAIAPSRSAEGCAIHMADPHLEWKGMAVFHEARVHAGEHGQCGFYLVGTPFPLTGHTAHVAWANTLGPPDVSDIFMVKLNPANPLQYEYNGEWRDFEVAMITVEVKGQPALEKPALYSLHGPVVEEPDPAKGIAYCAASPYFESTGVLEEMYRYATARSCDEFYEALAMNQVMGRNVVFADRGGNIQYVRSGCTPIRPTLDLDWSVPVPGGSDATRWQGFHGIADSIQIKNPPQGYMQNCNTAPSTMMKDCPMTRDKYLPYIYNLSWEAMTPRGERLRQLLDPDESITKEEALAYTTDVYDILAERWKKALRAAMETAGAAHTPDAEFMTAVKTILEWDGQFTRDSKAAPLVFFWRAKCDKPIPVLDIADEKPLSKDDQVRLLNLLGEALEEMKAKYGTLDLTWGDVNFIGRGGKYYPCPGAELGGWSQKAMTETVFNVGSRELPEEPGKYVAFAGSSALLVTFLYADGIESYSMFNWGQSSDPKSPHYVDQAEKLYAERKFKPTWFKKEDLMKNLESEKTLIFQ